MWSDNETAQDLLGFQIHCDLIHAVVTDANLLPTTIGIFGDWGSGKSSVMRMLQKKLEQQKDVACIYFNGWQFEGYEDAKAALIYSILLELAEHQKVVPKAKKRIQKFIKKIDWLKVANYGYQTLVPALMTYIAAQSGGVPVVTPPSQPLSSPPTTPAKAPSEIDPSQIDLSEIVKENPAAQGLMGARQLRQDFAELITETKLSSLIILIDDLDRCEPERLVETLEAIKLFLAVDRVAFVIGADLRIVRYAIAKRYEIQNVAQDSGQVGELELVTDYVEKLIQIPYHLPRLSPSEIETYMSLLFCEYHLQEKFDDVYQACLAHRQEDITATFGYQQIEKAGASTQQALSDELRKQLAWCSIIAPVLGDTLKGNPRQIKRLLNALVLRRKLAEAAQLTTLSDQILVKLMLLEYLKPELFTQLYHWQVSQNGIPQEIAELEKFAADGQGIKAGSNQSDKNYAAWLNDNIKQWLQMQPSLAQEDLRGYFWITRDRVSGILSGVSTLPRHMRLLLAELAEVDNISSVSAEVVTQIKSLSVDEQQTLLSEMAQRFRRAEDKRNLTFAWSSLCEHLTAALTTFLTLLESIPSNALYDTTPTTLANLLPKNPNHKRQILGLLRKWSTEKTKIGRLAEDALEDLEQ